MIIPKLTFRWVSSKKFPSFPRPRVPHYKTLRDELVIFKNKLVGMNTHCNLYEGTCSVYQCTVTEKVMWGYVIIIHCGGGLQNSLWLIATSLEKLHENNKVN